MIQSFFVYFIAICVLEASAIKYKNLKYPKIYFRHPLIIGMLLFYTLLCAFRYNVGVDYPVYLHEFERYKIYSSYVGVNNFEIGWAWLSWFLSTRNISYIVYFGLIAFLQFYFLLLSFRRKPYLLPGVIVAFFFGHFFLDFQNVIRQNLVMTVFLAIVMNKNDVCFIKSIIILGVCFFIHRSALLAVLLLPFIYISKPYKYELKIAPVLFVICVVVGLKYDIFSNIVNNNFFVTATLNSQYAYYLDDEFVSLGMGRTRGMGFLLKCIVDFLLISSGFKLYQQYKGDNTFISCYRFFYIGKCLKYLVPTSMVLGRPILYLTFFTLPILAYFFYYFISRGRRQSGVGRCKDIVLLISLCILFFADYFINAEGNMSEFHFIWEY